MDTAALVSAVRVDVLILDPVIQPREQMDASIIDGYGEDMENGAEFPPIVVYTDGTTSWVADGFHRVNGALRAGRETLLAEVREGTRRDALLFAAGANASHGLRRTNADKRRAVERLLRDPEWKHWSDPAIGRACSVSHEFVRRLRPTILQPLQDAESSTTRTVERNGTVYTMDTSAIGERESAMPDVRRIEDGIPFEPALPPARRHLVDGMARRRALEAPAEDSEERRALAQVLALASTVTRYDPMVMARCVPRESASSTRKALVRLARWLNGVAALTKGPQR